MHSKRSRSHHRRVPKGSHLNLWSVIRSCANLGGFPLHRSFPATALAAHRPTICRRRMSSTPRRASRCSWGSHLSICLQPIGTREWIMKMDQLLRLRPNQASFLASSPFHPHHPQQSRRFITCNQDHRRRRLLHQTLFFVPALNGHIPCRPMGSCRNLQSPSSTCRPTIEVMR